MKSFDDYLDSFIDQAIAEDIGSGDHSSNCSIPKDAEGQMYLLVKESGVIAGLEVAERVFKRVDEELRIDFLVQDGDWVEKGNKAFTIKGRERSLLRSERLALNLMQRMSGIATKTNHLNGLLKGTKAKLLDTRKTTPNLRYLEKKSVLIGGGQNHRMGLYDMIMLKDNHIDFAGGIKPAILKAQQYIQEQKLKIPIEVETRNINELQEVLNTGGVQRVMFDNYTIEQTKEGVKLVNGLMETESSGGITDN
jgi:nicotinate-nucleotide pyrophosphorylase (carboxylating)